MEVGFALTFQRLSGFEMSPVDMALSAQKAEHTFIGVKCGIMDQYISRMGRKDHALLIDCRSLEYRAISIPVSQAPGYVFVVGDTKVRRKLATSKYNERRAECEEAVRLLRPVLPGITALRDVSSSQLKQHMELLPANVLKRARHVVTEDERVMQAVEAVHAGDLAAFGRLMNDSHDSLRDDYEVSCDELNVIVNAARAVPGVLGSRMTGAGFGGCTVTLCETDAVDNLISAVRGRYGAAFGVEPSVYACAAVDGAREISGPE
jgi:galactokinase